MRQALGIRYLAMVMLVLFLAGCTETYAYLPSVGSKGASGAEAQPAATQPGPAAEAPAPAPKPDLPQQVQALETRVQQLETRLTELEGRQAAPAAPPAARVKERPATLSPSKAAYPAPATAAPGAADKTYAEGYHLYQTKKYAQARTKFSQYLKEQSKGAKAQEARYYLADSFYQEAKYSEAASEFNKMASQYPKSVLAPAALLRQALAYQNLQQTASYRSTLKKLTQAYPQSPEAKEASKWLKEGKKVSARQGPGQGGQTGIKENPRLFPGPG